MREHRLHPGGADQFERHVVGAVLRHLVGQDHHVGTEGTHPLVMVGVAHGRHHPGAGHRGQLHRRRPDATGRSGDEDGVALAQVGLGEQGVLGGRERLGEPAGGHQVDRLGHREQHRLGHDHLFGLSAAAADGHHPGADREPGGALTQGLHRAGELEPGDVRRGARRGRIEALPLEQVGPVDAGGGHRHHHLTGSGNGVGVLQPVEFLVDDGDRAHASGYRRRIRRPPGTRRHACHGARPGGLAVG